MNRLAISLALLALSVSQVRADPARDDQVKFFADAAMKSIASLEKAKAEARSAASNYQQMAELRCRLKLPANAAYQAATEDLARTQRVLDQARSLHNAALITSAISQISQLQEGQAKIEADALATDVDVLSARAILATIDPPAAAPAPVAPATIAARPAATPLFRPGTVSSPLLATPGAPASPGSPAALVTDKPARPHVPVLTFPAGVRPTGEQIGRMIHGGWDAVMSQQYDDAVTMLNRVIGTDTRDVTALLGRGIAKYELKDYKAAAKDLERAYGMAGNSSRISRQLTIATAATAMLNGAPMRGVKLIEDLMKATEKSGKVDEELQNDLGTALAHVDPQARLLQTYDEAMRYFLACDKKLSDQKQDGTGHWGITWISAPAAVQKWGAYADAARSVAQATSAFQHSGKTMEMANDHLQEAVGGLRLHSDSEILRYKAEMTQAIGLQVSTQAAMNQAVARLNSIEKPPFPDRIEFDWAEPR